MAKRILAATEMRQNLREVLGSLDSHNEPYYVTQRSRPTAVLARYDDYEALVAKAREAEQLKSALRWSLGFIANISAAMELQDEPAKYIHLLEMSIRQGLKRGSVPRGVVTRLDEVAGVIKEWDHKTFRLHEDARVLERTKASVVLGRSSCPYVLEAMRHHAPFHVKRIGWRDYRGEAKDSVSDFLCVCCGLCSSALVDWLSDGKLMVQELGRAERSKWKDCCVYAVRDKGVGV
ncbi:MAG: type II toxin-antitoxin system Phd/YefM family antitoxin [Chloroflexi bacterium]|nr:type II toxin-antitoxin system Phd/YefM family antitoxin [Chloroflexota bacterium]